MDKLNCVKVSLVLVDNKNVTRLTPEIDGFLGHLKPTSAEALASTRIGHAEVGMKIRLAIQVTDEEQANVWGFMVDNQKNMTMKRNYYHPVDPSKTLDKNKAEAARRQKVLGNHKAYVADIQVKWSDKKKCLHTEYPFNNLRVLRLSGNVVEEWEFSVTSQGGKFFLSEQKVYTWTVWRNGLTIGSFEKGLDDWPQMLKTLWHLFGAKVNALPCYTDALVIDEPEMPEEFAENQGRVIWWNEAKGLGVLNTSKGQARVHWTQVTPSPRKRSLTTGMLVSYKELAEPKTNPGQSTSFEYEAKGVAKV